MKLHIFHNYDDWADDVELEVYNVGSTRPVKRYARQYRYCQKCNRVSRRKVRK